MGSCCLGNAALLSILLYSVFSSSMLLVNKLTLHFIHLPSLISLVQICFSVVFVVGAKATGLLQVDDLERGKAGTYSIYVALFAVALLCNMKSLATSNVETVILFRSLTPMTVAVLDCMFLGREAPSPRAWGAYALVAAGAVGYARSDAAFLSAGAGAYKWPAAYAAIISVEMAYGKAIVHGVDMRSKIWGPVYYTNALAVPVMGGLFLAGDETATVRDAYLSATPAAVALLLAGCVLGTGISYAGWLCRSQTSATTYTIVGLMNKCLTIFANQLVWRRHASARGVAALLLCLLGGVVYRQAPLRDPSKPDLAIARVGKCLRRVCGCALVSFRARLPSARSPKSTELRKRLLKDHLSDTSLDERDDDDSDRGGHRL